MLQNCLKGVSVFVLQGRFDELQYRYTQLTKELENLKQENVNLKNAQLSSQQETSSSYELQQHYDLEHKTARLMTQACLGNLHILQHDFSDIVNQLTNIEELTQHNVSEASQSHQGLNAISESLYALSNAIDESNKKGSGKL